MADTLINESGLIPLVYAFGRFFIYIYHASLVFAPVLCVIYIIIVGIKFSASAGSKERIQSAKKNNNRCHYRSRYCIHRLSCSYYPFLYVYPRRFWEL
jgi:hypothetical protein